MDAMGLFWVHFTHDPQRSGDDFRQLRLGSAGFSMKTPGANGQFSPP